MDWNESVGAIVDYKYIKGPKVGKIYQRRFENMADFMNWILEYETPGIVKTIRSRVVTSDTLYWDSRWEQAVKA